MPLRYQWPEGKRSAVVLSFDFDAESGFIFREPEKARRSLGDLEERRFGPRVGVDRILSLLDRLKIRATFYIPGWTVVNHLAPCRRIRDAGHEIGAHVGQLRQPPEAGRADARARWQIVERDRVRGHEPVVRLGAIRHGGERQSLGQRRRKILGTVDRQVDLPRRESGVEFVGEEGLGADLVDGAVEDAVPGGHELEHLHGEPVVEGSQLVGHDLEVRAGIAVLGEQVDRDGKDFVGAALRQAFDPGAAALALGRLKGGTGHALIIVRRTGPSSKY